MALLWSKYGNNIVQNNQHYKYQYVASAQLLLENLNHFMQIEANILIKLPKHGSIMVQIWHLYGPSNSTLHGTILLAQHDFSVSLA